MDSPEQCCGCFFIVVVGQHAGVVPLKCVAKSELRKGGKYLDTEGRIGIYDGTNISKCEHSRQMSNCKESGRASICEHCRIRSGCKECGVSQICEHGRIRSECKECKACKGSKDTGEAVFPDSVSIVDAADC